MINSVSHKNAGNQNLAYREYWRDNRDRITAWKRGTGGGLNGMEDGRGDRYLYDAEGQLEIADYRALTPEGTPNDPRRRDHFYYDELGNRKGWNDVASQGTVNFTRENRGLNQYLSWTPSAINYDDDLGTSWGAPGRANGVTMQEGYITASFNALNQPMGIWSPGNPSGQFLWFGYDPLGRCVKRWLGSATGTAAASNPAAYYYYDGWNLVQEGSNGSTADRTYVHGGRVDEIVASQVGGQWYNHHYDARGHCIMLTTANGGLQEQCDYDAFGFPYFYTETGVNLASSAAHTRFLFTGREWLNDLRIYDFRNRIYQPELGRFLQPDPKEFAAGDYNLYRYCHNDPINKQDPLGLDPGEPFKTRKEAAADAIKFINPTSIKQNAEHGGLTYKGADGQHYATNPRTDGAGNKVNLRLGADKMGVPKDGKVDGDYHTHGDYSMAVKNNRTGGFTPVRATKSQDGYKSDHFGGTDIREAIRQFNQNPEFRRYLGTPSSQVLMYDPTTNREVPQ